jgi:hypothetical protein
MNLLYLDCSAGASGDMLASALLELLPNPPAAVADLEALHIPDVAFRLETLEKCGIPATHLAVSVRGAEEGNAPAPHPHDHGRTLDDILRLVGSLPLAPAVARHAADVYHSLADAESRAHRRPVAEIHFHELGTADALADIVAVCWLLDRLSPADILASPVNVGQGTVRCAHGILPVPAPATADLLRGIPTYAGGLADGECCTPTGAALLRHFVRRFGPQPPMRVSAIGQGAGRRDFPRANILRAFLGTPAGDIPGADAPGATDDVLELACNIDDMTGEDLAIAAKRLFEAGALDVTTSPVLMKKGRPGVTLRLLCPPSARADLVAALFRHTTTIGLRETLCHRYLLQRRIETATLPDGTPVRRKISEGYGVRRVKTEADDRERLPPAP